MKKCVRCRSWKQENEYRPAVKRHPVKNFDEFDVVVSSKPMVYMHTWCSECHARYRRKQRGTMTTLDRLIELDIEILDKIDKRKMLKHLDGYRSYDWED